MRTSSKSMIVVAAGLGLVVLGFLGYRKMASKNNEKKTPETPQPSVEASKTENVDDAKISQEPKVVENIKEDEVGDVDKLVKEIILGLLNKDCNFKGHDHFMSEFVRISFKNIIDPRWYEKLPRDTNEMIALVKTYGNNTYRLYERKVLGINNGLSRGGKKKKYSVFIYRRSINKQNINR